MRTRPIWLFAGALAGFVVLILVGVGALSLWYFSPAARFARSRPALTAYAETVAATPALMPLPASPSRLGAFHTGTAERLPHGFLVFCDVGNPFDQNGIAYSTTPLPRRTVYGRDDFEPIEGNWYWFYRL